MPTILSVGKNIVVKEDNDYMNSIKKYNFEGIFDFARKEVEKQNQYYDAVALKNTEKIIAAFRKHQVSDFYMKPTNGYAYNDLGREKLDAIYADIFGTEAALVRSQFVSGTHALAVAMIGNLQAGDEVIGATGTPYDTMQTIIGFPKKTPGSLVDMGIIYKEIPMTGSYVDIHAVCRTITDKTKMVHIQRSCGYSDDRNTLDVASIGRLIQEVHKVRKDIICFVDNCYGEFTELKEPTNYGADLMAGSLIKNPGGGLAPTGGYIVGRKELVYNAACRLTVPGLAGEMGATLGGDTARAFYQGLFMAPHVVMQAVKTAVYAAAVFRKLGYKVKPLHDEIRHDIIQSITLKTEHNLEKFCIAIQLNSPVDAHVTPVPDYIPGYQDKVIMAAGTFVQGSSIELSADGPIRNPYNAFLQGGLTYEHGQTAINAAAKLIGAATEKKKEALKHVILNGEKDKTLLKTCEEILNTGSKSNKK